MYTYNTRAKTGGGGGKNAATNQQVIQNGSWMQNIM